MEWHGVTLRGENVDNTSRELPEDALVLICNQRVGGSNPSAGSKILKDLTKSPKKSGGTSGHHSSEAMTSAARR